MGPINNMPALPELEALFVIKGQPRESKKKWIKLCSMYYVRWSSGDEGRQDISRYDCDLDFTEYSGFTFERANCDFT